MLAAALAVVLSAAPSPGAPEVYAVVVGHNGGAEGLPELRYADDDAVRFALLFSALAPADHVVLLAEPDAETRRSMEDAGLPMPALRPPTRTALFAALAELGEKLAARPGAETAVYFVYAGHGLRGHFAMKPELAGEEAAVTGRELRAAIAALPATRATLLFDACRSQSLFVERGGVEQGPDLSAQIAELERKAASVKIGVLTAATSDKPAGEVADLQSGYFSHVLASALAGAADADGDDLVSYGELAAFVAYNTERLTGQKPWFDPPDGDLRATALDLRGRPTRLVLGAGEAGRFLIEAARGRPVFAEVNKTAGRALRLSLPAGRYRVVRLLADGRGATGEVELAEGSAPVVTADSLPTRVVLARAAERGDEIAWDGARAGFQAPFTAEVVSALSVGYQSGREPSGYAAVHRHAFGAGFGVAPPPFGLAGYEPGVELVYRFALPRGFFAGARVDYRSSSYFQLADPVALRRSGVAIYGGARWTPLERLELMPWLGAGARAVWREARGELTSGDFAAPLVEGGLLFAWPVGDGFALLADARAEASFVAVDGARRTVLQPSLGIGFEVRR